MPGCTGDKSTGFATMSPGDEGVVECADGYERHPDDMNGDKCAYCTSKGKLVIGWERKGKFKCRPSWSSTSWPTTCRVHRPPAQVEDQHEI